MLKFNVFVSRQGNSLSTQKNGATREVRAVASRDRIDHVEALEGGASVKSDQVPRGKLCRVVKSVFTCFC